MMGSYSKLPGGDIAPSRFVKLSSTAGQVLQCGANEAIFGISSPTTRRHALPGWDDGLAGKLGDGAINIIGPGDDEALLELGGTVVAGDHIKSDASAKGVAGNADKDRIGAIALVPGVAGDLIRVKPVRFDVSV